MSSSRRILITGGAGNVGGSLARELVRRGGSEVLVVDNLQTGTVEKLPPSGRGFSFIRADVNDYADIAPVFFGFRPDFVFHYAATVGVERTTRNPMMVLDDISGIRNVLTLCKGLNVQRVFYSSSSEVYGEPVEFPQKEDSTPLNSRLPYAVVKNLGEIFMKTFEREFGLPYTVFRFFNTYGPLQSTDFVVSRFITQALKGEDITVYGEGDQSRTFCYVDDNVAFQIQCLDEDLHINDTVNVGSDREVSVLELANLVIERLGSKSKVVHKPALKEGDMRRRVPDNGKMRQALGRELISIEEGIDRTAEFIRANLKC
ncbi:MAG TPA: NAD-dependent epimerase/dehydratase family protein [Sphingomicrobium sp.]|jgi:UDP-glucuronate decarboxylase|nr:NAD-dependent epimerase/dehydratase family protein [Sphingomicrobium sp.]